MVNELSVRVRIKELILVALWFGKDKPNMDFSFQSICRSNEHTWN